MNRFNVRLLFLVIFCALMMPLVAYADNCSSPGDCMQTAGYNAIMALAGGFLGIGAGLYASRVAAGMTPTPTPPPPPTTNSQGDKEETGLNNLDHKIEQSPEGLRRQINTNEEPEVLQDFGKDVLLPSIEEAGKIVGKMESTQRIAQVGEVMEEVSSGWGKVLAVPEALRAVTQEDPVKLIEVVAESVTPPPVAIVEGLTEVGLEVSGESHETVEQIKRDATVTALKTPGFVLRALTDPIDTLGNLASGNNASPQSEGSATNRDSTHQLLEPSKSATDSRDPLTTSTVPLDPMKHLEDETGATNSQSTSVQFESDALDKAVFEELPRIEGVPPEYQDIYRPKDWNNKTALKSDETGADADNIKSSFE